MDEQVRIWQRVKGETPPVTEGLPGLAANALAQATLYGSLARQMQGPGRNILLALQEEEQRCARCLKGIWRMVTGKRMQPAALRKSYGQSLKTLAAFESRAFHPEYGPVFAHLAAKKREHCCEIAELLGF